MIIRIYIKTGWNNFYERYMSGKKTPRTGWVNGSDYEKKPLD